MAKTFSDFSQLKKFRPAEPEPPPAPPPAPEDRQLADSANSADYFSSLLGTGTTPRQKPPRATVVTPSTITRVRAEQAEDAFAAERESLEAELAERQSVIDALALDSVQQKESLAQTQEKLALADMSSSPSPHR